MSCTCSCDSEAEFRVAQEELVEASCDLPLVAEPVLEEEPKPEEAVPEKVKEKVANFSGEWTLERIEGDFDAFLKEMGVGYMARSLAKSRGYGVKSVHQAVEHSLDKIKVVQTTPKGTTVSEIRLDGTEQDSTDPIENRAVKVLPKWDGQTLVIVSRSKDKELITVRRHMRGEETVQELETPGKVLVKRVFCRVT
eukprot:CAMPEP_0181447396 /NCGR_PEP_ID=MMETSP1110-20121109/26600_1 /TAXON_ID=174948 /ORGANISM="Symbiodinium sp., Strain CCMP421" /LENGTH=194 /DNA_ID=CAMNT_0023571507 /DNA_START=1 /DNA_END=585 /DNA_ORIENTATION=+